MDWDTRHLAKTEISRFHYRSSHPDHYGQELRQADEAHALTLLQQELKARGWKEADLAERPAF